MNLANYNKNNQVEWLQLTLKKGNQLLDILSIMDQFILYEDMLQGPMSARLIFRDQINLVGSLPIVGGEEIHIKYRTPVYDTVVDLTMIVYSIGERGIVNSAENIQINQLMLCTPEVWRAANVDTEAYYKGTYSDIIGRILTETTTTKAFDREESVGIVEYVAPSIPAFKAIKFCASRANSQTASPMFFWETSHGYRLQSLKQVYRASFDKFVYIEDRAMAGADTDANKVFNTAYSFEYLDSNNRLAQYQANAFGSANMMVDFTNKRLVKINNSYDDVFNRLDIKLNKFPLNDPAISFRSKDSYIPYHPDLSHLNAYNRIANLSMMDNLRVMASIPGDSELQAGNIVWMEIPAKVGLNVGSEPLSSGKWLVRSLKHLITKTTYTMICELTKDSFDVDVNKGA